MSEIERVQFKLMLPVHMKQALEEAAHNNRRSLSAEIIQRLYTTLEMDEYEPGANVNADDAPPLTSDLFDKIFSRLLKIEDGIQEVIQNSVDAKPSQKKDKSD